MQKNYSAHFIIQIELLQFRSYKLHLEDHNQQERCFFLVTIKYIFLIPFKKSLPIKSEFVIWLENLLSWLCHPEWWASISLSLKTKIQPVVVSFNEIDCQKAKPCESCCLNIQFGVPLLLLFSQFITLNKLNYSNIYNIILINTS